MAYGMVGLFIVRVLLAVGYVMFVECCVVRRKPKRPPRVSSGARYAESADSCRAT
jgi:hypothetical protein